MYSRGKEREREREEKKKKKPYFHDNMPEQNKVERKNHEQHGEVTPEGG